MDSELPPDTLNEIGVLKRREIEARILAPMIEALGAEFGRERVIEIVTGVIVEIARRQGRALAERQGGSGLAEFLSGQEPWLRGGALQIEGVEATETRLQYNVTRCQYAEMYRALGIPELGAVLSCGRDGALGEGFNPAMKLTRSQTIMEGASHCDFRYRLDGAEHRAPSAAGHDGSTREAGTDEPQEHK
jgi:hypothetical protein